MTSGGGAVGDWGVGGGGAQGLGPSHLKSCARDRGGGGGDQGPRSQMCGWPATVSETREALPKPQAKRRTGPKALRGPCGST